MGSIIKRNYTLQEKVLLSCASKEEKNERDVLQRLQRVKDDKETPMEKTKRSLLDFLYAETDEKLAITSRTLRNITSKIKEGLMDILEMIPSINMYDPFMNKKSEIQ